MTRVKTKLIEDIRRNLGVDATSIVQYLYDFGTLDDCLARQHVAKTEVIRLMTTTDLSERTIHGDVAEDLGLTRERVGQLGRNISPRG